MRCLRLRICFSTRNIARSSESSRKAAQELLKSSSLSEMSSSSLDTDSTEVSEMDAAMHFIDFQKPNWWDLYCGMKYRGDLFEVRKKVLGDLYME